MLFDIRHETAYSYSQRVFLEPHALRFRPRTDGSQWLDAFEIAIEPEPLGTADVLDAEGNSVLSVWFGGLHNRLSVSVHARVRTTRENPFDYLLSDAVLALPMEYCRELQLPLAPARHRTDLDKSIDALAERVWLESADVLDFLNRLNRTIYGEIEVVRRIDGPPVAASEVLRRRKGPCRDLAVLFIEVCRAAGLAARFVSGYQEGTADQPERDLHAWAEVYLPGGGWRGYDPTLGLAVGDRHVVVAAATEPSGAAPVSGVFRGNGVSSFLTTNITISGVEASTFPLRQQPQQQRMAQ